MFDPTIYENLKVVLEGAVYDLDLAGAILVTNRSDIVDLSTMSRSYLIQFREKNTLLPHEILAEVRLSASMSDLAEEILELPQKSPGCQLDIHFYTQIKDVEQDCRRIQETLDKIWGNRPAIEQQLSFMYREHPATVFQNTIKLSFGRKIDEQQIEDIPPVIDHVLHSLQSLKS